MREEEESAKVTTSPASYRSAATPKQKKGRKSGCTSFILIFSAIQILKKVLKDTLSHAQRVWLLFHDLFDHSSFCSKMREGKIQFPHHSHALVEQFLPLFYSWFRQEVIILQSEK